MWLKSIFIVWLQQKWSYADDSSSEDIKKIENKGDVSQ